MNETVFICDAELVCDIWVLCDIKMARILTDR